MSEPMNQECTSLGQMIYLTRRIVVGLEMVRAEQRKKSEHTGMADQLIDWATDLQVDLELHKQELAKNNRQMYRLGRFGRGMSRKAEIR